MFASSKDEFTDASYGSTQAAEECHTIEACQEGEDVQELEAELKKVRNSLRELTSDLR